MDLIPHLPSLPSRPSDGHKGTFGKVLLVSGSRGMSGAAALAGLAALRTGSGLVFVAVPESILPIVAGFEPSYLTVGLPEDAEGRIADGAYDRLRERLGGCDAAGLGPGIGQSDALQALIASVYREATLPLVLDADALNLLSRNADQLSEHAGPRVLTPHPGEFARLTGEPAPTTDAERQEAAVAFAARYNVVLLLKGAGTIITDGEHVAVNQTGNSGMATGGTGDVLTGVITSLLGQGMTPLDAAHLGAHLHGLAGDLAARELTKPALIASDLPKYLGAAWKQLGAK